MTRQQGRCCTDDQVRSGNPGARIVLITRNILAPLGRRADPVHADPAERRPEHRIHLGEAGRHGFRVRGHPGAARRLEPRGLRDGQAGHVAQPHPVDLRRDRARAARADLRRDPVRLGVGRRHRRLLHGPRRRLDRHRPRLQNAVGSLLSGLFLVFEQPFELGDYLVTPSGKGAWSS